jgi:hypothetical protein
VGLAAVELHDQALVGVEPVDGERADAFVHEWSRDAVGVEEGEEGELQVGSRDRPADLAMVDDRLQRLCPPPPAVACEQGFEGMWAREPPELRLVDRAFELVRREDLGQIQQGPGGRRDRDAALDGDLVRRERGAAAVDAGPAPLPGRDDLDVCPRRVADSPQRGGGAVAQDRSEAGGEDGRHPVALPCQPAMADRVDALMDAVETAGGQPVPDRAAPEPQFAQLRPGDHAMLTGRQLGDHGVNGSSAMFCTHVVLKIALDSHPAMVPLKV